MHPLTTSPILILSCIFISLNAAAQQTLEIGPGKPYQTLEQAALAAQPGDTLQFLPGDFAGGMYIENLQGSSGAWITIRGASNQTTRILGGANAIQFTDPAYLSIENLTFREQTGNGVNIDDGGSFATPAHHLWIRDCVFEDMNANGNNDLLKLSGLDTFHITSCVFQNGAAGGSGIDMVGCHQGIIARNHFENLGSNSIQAKGGTRYIQILQNTLMDGGARGINLGGSTGAAFFRPLGADYEAADLDVAGNLFIGSQAPVAYVGSQRVRVWNNTIYRPDKWVMRILQESADTSFYKAVSDGEFVNNLVIVDNALSIATNIGPNTNSASFLIARNLWYHLDQSNWSGPFLPSPEIEGLVQVDPQVTDHTTLTFTLLPTSPAIQAGWSLPDPSWLDHDQQPFLDPPSIGAFEGGMKTSTTSPILHNPGIYFPNPAHDRLHRTLPLASPAVITDGLGRPVMVLSPGETSWSLPSLPTGKYQISEKVGQHRQSFSLLIFR